MESSLVTIGNVLTRTSGFLRDVSSHSLQPYRGCTFGNALCGVGCYVRHNQHLLRGRRWGEFLEIRTNAADSYRANYARERGWAQRRNGQFSIFCSSSTDPFLPQESRYHVTQGVLEAMLELPPDELILQTHTHCVARHIPLFRRLAERCRLRIHISIETDREEIPGLPPHASPIARRLEACAALRDAGLRTIVTVAPLLPIADPHRFFARLGEVADAVVLDHFIQGDGSLDGSRTLKTGLPARMAEIDPASAHLEYRDRMAAIAREYLPGRVGLNIEGFAGKYT